MFNTASTVAALGVGVSALLRLGVASFTQATLLAGQAAPDMDPLRAVLAPPAGKCLLCVGEDADAIDEYVLNTKQVPAGFMVRTHLNAWNDQVMGIERLKLDGVQDFTVVKRHPNTVLQVGLVFCDCQPDVIAGKFDAKVRRLAQWFKEAGIPVYVRVGVEFDNPHPRYRHEPEGYKQAYARIHDIIEREGASNVRYVWHTFTRNINDVFDWYPGDNLVDWFGVSIYGPENFGPAKGFAAEAKKRGKPLMIAEAGVKGGNANWQRFSNRLFRFVKSNEVAMLCLISEDFEQRENYAGEGWGDMRVHVPPLLDGWTEQVKAQGLLLGSNDLYRVIGFR